MRVLRQDGWIVEAIARPTQVEVTVGREGETVHEVELDAKGYVGRWDSAARDERGQAGAQTHGTMFKVQGRTTGDFTISWAQAPGGERRSVTTKLER